MSYTLNKRSPRCLKYETSRLATYASMLRVLGLQGDLDLVARGDMLGRKLQKLKLPDKTHSKLGRPRGLVGLRQVMNNLLSGSAGRPCAMHSVAPNEFDGLRRPARRARSQRSISRSRHTSIRTRRFRLDPFVDGKKARNLLHYELGANFLSLIAAFWVHQKSRASVCFCPIRSFLERCGDRDRRTAFGL